MNPLTDQFGKEKRWVTWKLQTRKGKATKVPYARGGGLASSTDESTWSTLDELTGAKNIGIVFTPAQDLLGIDIDHCLLNNEINHEQKEAIEKFIKEADTYTEISPSGEGLHLFLKIESALELSGNKHAPFELYTQGRYFTVTGNVYGRTRAVRTVSKEDALQILGIIGYPWNKEEKSDHTPPATSQAPLSMDDATLLEKMFNSKTGLKIKALYYGDTAAYGNDESAADMSLCSSLAFWTGKNADQMKRIWLGSPLGARKKTQERKDYSDRTIAVAIKTCKEVYESRSMKVEKENPTLDLLFVLNEKKDKVFIQNTENMCRILKRHPDFAGRFRYDVFKNKFQVKDDVWRDLEDNDAVEIQTQVSILFPNFGKVGKEMIFDAIIKTSKDNTIDSALMYVKSLTWDKEPRLDQWLHHTYGTPDDDYHKAVGSNWFKGMVKRIVEPGCKFDYVLVLEGPQGAKKSMSLNVLGGDWYVETTMSTDTKDFFMQFTGNLIIEFSEGETLNRTEVKKMKAIITTQNDKYRPAYGRSIVEFPRRCVFSMTTNDEEYLKDETGNRRWLPVKLTLPEANVEWLRENRDQLFAEAHYRIVEKKETVYEFPKEEMKAEQDKRRVHYEHEEEIVSWYYNALSDEKKSNGITVHQVYQEALGNTFSKMLSKYDEMKISGVLKDTLRLKKERVMLNAHRAWRWFGPEHHNSEGVLVKTEIVVDNFDL